MILNFLQTKLNAVDAASIPEMDDLMLPPPAMPLFNMGSHTTKREEPKIRVLKPQTRSHFDYVSNYRQDRFAVINRKRGIVAKASSVEDVVIGLQDIGEFNADAYEYNCNIPDTPFKSIRFRIFRPPSSPALIIECGNKETHNALLRCNDEKEGDLLSNNYPHIFFIINNFERVELLIEQLGILGLPEQQLSALRTAIDGLLGPQSAIGSQLARIKL